MGGPGTRGQGHADIPDRTRGSGEGRAMGLLQETLALLLRLLPDTKHTHLRIKNAKLAAQAMMKAYLLIGEQNIFDLVAVV